ncbi:T9SS type A sorting domain-containing protein [Labilibacter sediminis]|nr:T9SS type A sorting domain-containing protein [Labilibacter sediminis]
MKRLFTTVCACAFTLFSFAQIPDIANLPYQGSFESAEGYTLGGSASGTASFEGKINTSVSFFNNCHSGGEKATTVTVVADAQEGDQALKITVGPGVTDPTTDIRLRTESYVVEGTDFLYDNGMLHKLTCWAKTDAAGVALGNATGGIIGLKKGECTTQLTESYQKIEIYGKVSNKRVQIWFQNQPDAATTYNIWIDNVTIEEVDFIPVEPEFTTFPYTETFESTDYVVSATPFASYDGVTASDTWLTTTPQVFQGFWKGASTASYGATVDADANNGSKAFKLNISGLADVGFWLRTVPIPAGDYTVSFYAKTDAAGVSSNAQFGFENDPNTFNDLTTSYQLFTGTGSAVEGNNKLTFFYTGYNTNNVNIWIDDITIEEGIETSIDEDMAVELKLYPSPVISTLYINADGNIDKVTIYNISGQKMKEFTNVTNALDVSDLEKGLYVSSIIIDGNNVIRKFLKQ